MAFYLAFCLPVFLHNPFAPLHHFTGWRIVGHFHLNQGEEVDVILMIFNKVIELYCGKKNISDTLFIISSKAFLKYNMFRRDFQRRKHINQFLTAHNSQIQ